MKDELRDPAQALGPLFDAAPDGMILVDADGLYAAVNDAAEQLFGTARDEIIGQVVGAFSRDPGSARANWESTVAQGKHTGDAVIVQPDGSLRHVRFSARADVLPGFTLTILRDVTAERNAARDARRAGELYRSALTGSLDAFYLLRAERDADGALVDFVFEDTNERGTQLVRTPRETMIGARLCELFPVNRECGFVDRYAHVVESGETLEETFAIDTPELPRKWLRHQVVKAGDGVAISTRDVTEQVARKRQIESLAQIVATQRDGIISSDPSGRILSWNAGAERLLGVAADDAIGRNLFKIPALAPLRDETATALRGALDGEHVHLPRVAYARPDGRMLTIGVRASALVDHQGNTYGVSAIVYDATSLSELEEQLRQRSKLEAVGQLAGGVAHDFNNYLTVISGYSALLQTRCADSPDLLRLVEQIHTASDRAAGLTRQLLSFARRQTLDPTHMSLTGVVADLKQLVRRLVSEDVAVRFEVADAPCWVLADRTHLEQSILNLVTNARDALGAAGEIRVAAREATRDEVRQMPRRTPAERGTYHVLEVRDNGSGMDDATLARIFEPFFTTKAAGHGTGLGLATTYGIVRQSNGEINVESEPGEGTRFRIFLPAAEPPAAENETEASAPAEPASGVRILLVEDSPAVLMLVRETLESAGHSVDAAEDGKKGIRMLERDPHRWALLITDAVMPVHNGREVIEAARRLHPSIRAIMVSGYTADVLDGHEDVADVFLRKPFRPTELLDAVARLMPAD